MMTPGAASAGPSASWSAAQDASGPVAEYDRVRATVQARAASGAAVIDLTPDGVQDPPPEELAARLGAAETNRASQRPNGFNEAAARFLKRRYGVTVDARRDIFRLPDADNPLSTVTRALVQPGDMVLLPDPCHPALRLALTTAGVQTLDVPLRAELGWLPDLSNIRPTTARAARLMWINYPCNPVGAHAPHSFYHDVADFSDRYDVLIAADARFNELYFRVPPPSLMEYAAARARVLEVHASWSAFTHDGRSPAYAVGAADLIARLGPPADAPAPAAALALDEYMDRAVIAQRDAIGRRAQRLATGLRDAGWSAREPEATPFVWASAPGDAADAPTAGRLLNEADVAAMPGSVFGPGGAGYLRFTVASDAAVDAALDRIRRIAW